MSDPFASLDTTLDEVWRRLARGVAEKRAPARHPVLATVGEDGAEARIVVLRRARRDRSRVEIHTDLRTAKVGELRANPRASLVIWEPRAKLQIRLRVRFEVLEGDAVAPYWQAIPDPARSLYGGEPAPGTALAAPEDHAAQPDDGAYGVLRGKVEEIETLQLGLPRHRRARFRPADGWQGEWCAP